MPARIPARTRHAAGTALVTVAVLASMFALRTVVLDPWTATGVIAVLLVGGVLTATRALLEARARRGAGAWPTLAALVAAAWFLLARYGGPGGTTDLLVGGSSFGNVRDQLELAALIVREEIAPVPGTAPMALLCIGGTLTVLLAADAAAVCAGRPLLAAGVVLVLWLPPLVLTTAVPWPTFAATVAALLLGLTLSSNPVPRRDPHDTATHSRLRRAERHRALRTTTTAAAVVVVALTASHVAGGSGGAWTRMFTTRTTQSGTLADDLDISRSLRQRSDEVVLRYTTSTGQDVGPLRLATVSSFDGRTWAATDIDGDAHAPTDLLFSSPAAPAADPISVDVVVGTLRELRLPLATEPRTLSSDTAWRYDEKVDQVVRDVPTHEGETFAMSVHPRDLSAQALRAAPAGTHEVDDAYLDVPATAHARDTAALAAEITDGAATDLDRAVALQTHLRNPLLFTYDAEVPAGLTGDAVWDFLVQRQGYCVQFATAMVVLARSLDIPARLAVGYLPGEVTASGSWQVTGRDSHAWPELYFAGTGWVRFEPTPAVQTGQPPAHTNPQSAGPAPTPTSEPGQELAIPAASDPAATPGATEAARLPGTVGEEPASIWWIVTSVIGLAALAVVGTVLARRRFARTPMDVEEAWARVVGALSAAGVALPTSTTPRRAPKDAAAAWAAVRRSELPRQAHEGIVELARELERERYAPPTVRRDDPRRADRLARLTRQVTSGLKGGTPRS